MTRKHRKSWIKNIAGQQIKRLFELSESISEARPLMADRYVHIARQIGMRHRVRIPAHLKRRMCKHCGKYISGSTCRVRLNGTCVVVTCLACGKQTRYPYHHDRNHTPNKERE